MTPEEEVQIVRDAMGRTIHVCVVADAAEELGYSFPAGSELMNLVREERPEVVAPVVEQLVQALEKLNGAPLEVLISMAKSANPDLEFDEDTLRTLGHYMVMQSQGSGVSWDDDHEGYGLKTPLYFNPSDSIWVGLDDFSVLPGFDLEELKAEAEEDGNERRLEMLNEVPEQTQSNYIEGYEPPALGM